MREKKFCSFQVIISLVIVCLFLSGSPTLGAEWEFHQVDTYGSWAEGMSISVGTDASDKAHVSYIGSVNDDAYYATNKSGSWATELMGANGGDAPWGNDIAVRGDGSVSVIYNSLTGDVASCKCKNNRTGSWVTHDFGFTSHTVTAATANNSIPYVLLSDDDAGFLYFMKDIDPDGWTRIGPEDRFGWWQSAAKGPGNSMHFCYHGDSGYVYANDTSGSIVTELIPWSAISDRSIVLSGGHNLAIDSEGNAYIVCYYEIWKPDYSGLEEQGIGLLNNVGGSWHYDEAVLISDYLYYASIAIDLNDVIHIAYSGYGPWGIHYASNAGGTWSKQTLDSGGMWGNDICTDIHNGVHVTYYRTSDAAVMYAYTPGVTSGPQVEVEPASLDFGDVNTGDTETLPVTVTNTGTAELWITGIEITGDEEFTYVTDCNTLSPEQSCIIDVSFAPTAGGLLSGTLLINSNDSEHPQVQVDLTGWGVIGESQIEVEPNSLDFGSVNTGQTETLPITVTNTGSGDLWITGIQIIGDDDFTYVTDCNALPPEQSCVIDVSFTPTAEGSQFATLIINSNDVEQPQIQVNLAGWGVVYEPRIDIEPNSLDFGDVNIGETEMLSITVTNTGTAELWITGIEISGDADFTYVTDCNTLPPEQSCVIDFSFTPTMEGARFATLIIDSNDIEQPQVEVDLAGFGVSEKTWVKRYGRLDEYQNAYDIIQTQDSEYILTGYYHRGLGNVLLFLKLDAYGNIITQKTFGFPSSGHELGQTIVPLADGNYLLGGRTYNYGNQSGYGNGWLLKVNPQGETIWAHSPGGDSYEFISSAVECDDGDILFCGERAYEPGSSSYHGWVVRMDPNGTTIQWQKVIANLAESRLHQVIRAGDDRYAVAGSICLQQDYNYMYFAKYDGDGTCTMVRGYQPENVPIDGIDVEGYSLAVAPDGGFLLAGYVCENNNFPWDALVVKLTDTGDIEWQKKYGQPSTINNARSIISTHDGNFAFAGDSGGDGWLVKIDPSGNIIWQKIFGGALEDHITQLVETRDGGFALTGQTRSYSESNPQQYEIWVLKLDPDGNALGCDMGFMQDGNAVVSDANGVVLNIYSILPGETIPVSNDNAATQAGELTADTICDGVCLVDMEHLENFAAQWLDDSGSPEADLDHNGHVDSEDFAILSAQWLAQCPEGWPWTW